MSYFNYGNFYFLMFVVSVFLTVSAIVVIARKKDDGVIFAFGAIFCGIICAVGFYVLGTKNANNIVINTVKNYANEQKMITSLSEARELKILNNKDENLFTKLTGSKLNFIFETNKMTIEYEDMPLKSLNCESFLSKFENIEESKKEYISINNIKINEILGSDSKKSYICSQDKIIVSTELKKN